MAGSLQDQLLAAGLGDAKAAKEHDKAKRKQAKVDRRAGIERVDEAKQAAKQALAEKAQRARELNQERDSKAQRKAINAQIKQLVERHCLPKGGDVGFNFIDGSKVKKVYVGALEQQQLSSGRLAIVKQGDQYEILPRPVADKIAERDAARVIVTAEADQDDGLSAEEQDWYKDYEIPDDLMW